MRVNVPVFVVDLVTVAWGINDVQPQPDTIFGYDYEGLVIIQSECSMERTV
jgi:hypothetical protein